VWRALAGHPKPTASYPATQVDIITILERGRAISTDHSMPLDVLGVRHRVSRRAADRHGD